MSDNLITFDISAAEGEGKNPTVSGVAYRGDKLNLKYWADPVVVDMNGIEIPENLPLLANHRNSTADRVGVLKAEIIDNELIINGEITAKTELANNIVEQAKAGGDWQLSIGANSKSLEKVKEGSREVNGRVISAPFYHVTASVLREVSVVAVGADKDTNMKIAASFDLSKGSIMSEEKEIEAKEPEKKIEAKAPEKVEATGPSAIDVVKAERERVADVTAICGGEYPEIEAAAIRDGWDKGRTSDAVLAAMRAARPEAPEVIVPDRDVEAAGLEAAICLRAGIAEKDLVAQYGEKTMEAAHKDRAMSIIELCAACIRLEGGNVPRTFNNDTIRAAFSTVSLPGILNNVANKSLLRAFQAQAITATTVCSEADLRDFKEASRYRLTDVGDIEPIAEDGEIKHGGQTEESATNQLDTFGKMFALTRKMIINDDLGAFTRVPTAMGARAARKIDQLFYERLLSNPGTMFSLANGNYQTGAATALSIDALRTAEQLFLDQTDADGQPINIAPRYLLVPTSLKVTAGQILASTTVMTIGDTDTFNIPTSNVFAGSLIPVVSPYLNNGNFTGSSATGWYLFGDPGIVDTFEIGYLRGQRTPTVEQAATDFNTLGIQYRVYFDLGVREQGTRGMVFSTGA